LAEIAGSPGTAIFDVDDRHRLVLVLRNQALSICVVRRDNRDDVRAAGQGTDGVHERRSVPRVSDGQVLTAEEEQKRASGLRCLFEFGARQGRGAVRFERARRLRAVDIPMDAQSADGQQQGDDGNANEGPPKSIDDPAPALEYSSCLLTFRRYDPTEQRKLPWPLSRADVESSANQRQTCARERNGSRVPRPS